MEGLHETTLGLLTRLELSDVLQSIVVRAAALAGTQHGYLFLLEPGEAEMVMQVGAGFFSQRVGDRVRPGQSVARVAWQSGQPLAVGDYPNWPGRVPHPVFDQLKTLLAVPLKSGDKVVGVLGLGHVQMEAQQTLDETEIARTVQFAQLASIAVDNARRFSNAKAELEHRRRSAENLALMTYVSPDIPRFIKGDPVRIRQVLLNLMGNAIKFTERGEVVVTVDQTAETQTQLTLKFAVSDTGVGLSKTARERLFQPFMQADGSTTRKYGGTGLGLSISKHLASQMHGSITVEAER